MPSTMAMIEEISPRIVIASTPDMVSIYSEIGVRVIDALMHIRYVQRQTKATMKLWI